MAGQNPIYGLLCPVARVVLAAFHLESRWRAATGRSVRWKGRLVTPTGAGSSPTAPPEPRSTGSAGSAAR